jgi:hypothetical protein
VILGETYFRATVVCFETPAEKLVPNDRLFYGQYDKTNHTMVTLLKIVTEEQTSSETATLPATRAVRVPKLGKIAACVLLVGLLVVGELYYRSHESSHQTKRLTEKDTIVLADSANSTGDAIFDDTLKTTLNVSLRQSPFLNVLSDNEVAKTLTLMTRPAGTKLTLCLGCAQAQAKKSAVPIFRRMLVSHERSLVAARSHSEPAGQIAAREMEIVRIREALHRAEELSDDVALLSRGLFEAGQMLTVSFRGRYTVDEHPDCSRRASPSRP